MSEYIYGSIGDPLANALGEIYLPRAEVVRCRDCRYYNEKTYKWVNGWTRTSATCAVFDNCHVEPNGFCKWGEKREREFAEVWNPWSADDVTCSEES